LTGKGKNPKSEKDSAKPESAPKEVAPAAEEPEVTPPALAPSLKPKKEKKSSNLWGVIIFFFLIIAGGIGAGGFYLYQEQMKFRNETLAKLSQLEGQLNALDTEADQARQNKQSLDTLNQELQQFKTEMDTTLKTHQSSLATLDEDVMRLKEKVETPVEATPASPLIKDEVGTQPESIPGELFPESTDEEISEGTEAEEDDPDHESQKFVEWMENFFAAIWNWFAGLFS
jgi:TolA-binding protein